MAPNRERNSPAMRAHATRKIEAQKLRKQGMLILDCTSERQEQMSEGLLLKELVRILEPWVPPRVEKIRGVKDFKTKLRDSNESVIHVSAHGRFYRKRTTEIYFPSGKSITEAQIQKVLNKRHEKPMLMVFSACSVGNKDMAANLRKAGVRYLMAPLEDVYWFDAAIFLTVFYRFLLVENHSPWIAFRKIERMRKQFFPKLTGTWNLFEDGELCFSSPYSRDGIGTKLTVKL